MHPGVRSIEAKGAQAMIISCYIRGFEALWWLSVVSVELLTSRVLGRRKAIDKCRLILFERRV